MGETYALERDESEFGDVLGCNRLCVGICGNPLDFATNAAISFAGGIATHWVAERELACGSNGLVAQDNDGPPHDSTRNARTTEYLAI